MNKLPNGKPLAKAVIARHEKFRLLLREGCHQGCDYDEAEGDLMNHCDACCRKITAEAYALFA